MIRACLGILIFALVAVSGCTKEEADFRIADFATPFIHGYFARDEAGNPMGVYGYAQPNVNLGDKSSFYESNYYVTIFPNPTHNYLSVYTKSPEPNQMKKLWITPAILRPPFENGAVLTDSWNNFVAGGYPLLQLKFMENNAYLDLTDLPNGYYRLYLKVNDQLLFDNLVIDREFRPYR